MEEGTCRFHMGHRIRKLDNMLKRNMQLALSGLGVDEVTAMNGFIIQYLYHHADRAVYQRDIEKEFKIGRSAVTNILTRMEENGFIHRETDGSDARLKRLTLTAKRAMRAGWPRASWEGTIPGPVKSEESNFIKNSISPYDALMHMGTPKRPHMHHRLVA